MIGFLDIFAFIIIAVMLAVAIFLFMKLGELPGKVAAKRHHVPIIGYITETLETTSRLLPVFDIWSFRYTTSFELRNGMQPDSISWLNVGPIIIRISKPISM